MMNEEENINVTAGTDNGTTSTTSTTSAPNTIPVPLIHVEWMPEHELILVDWGDKALCYRWMHETAHCSYKRKNTFFTIPVIIMSTLTGTANFAQDRIPEEYLNIAVMSIGAVNLIAGILTTIQQYLKISELNEAHRVSSIAWGKFHRNIKVELSKPPLERTPVLALLKYAKEEFDRMIETSPTIPSTVVEAFNKTFSGGEFKSDNQGNPIFVNKKQKAFALLKKPEVCGSLESTSLSLFKPRLLSGTETKGLSLEELELQQVKKDIEAFSNRFKLERKRLPTMEEILNNLDKENITLSIDVIRVHLQQQVISNSEESFDELQGEDNV